MIVKFILALLLSVPFTIINFNGYLKGGPPSVDQIVSSLVFLLIWLAWAFYSNYKNKAGFLQFSTVYWLVAVLFTLLSYVTDSPFIFIPTVLVYLGPLYGLKFFMAEVSYNLFIYLCLVVGYAASLLGYFLGHINRKRKTKE